jgi:predicted MFS family arabinose efflux permease
MSFGMSAQNSVGTNFQVETLNMTALDRGYMETGRELPGLFLVLISALSAALPVPILAAVSILTMTLQYLGYSQVTAIWQLIGLTIFGSIGFHLWAPLQRELNMSQVDKANSGRVLGFMAGVGSAGALSGMASVWLFAPTLGYRTMFLWAAGSLAIAALLIWRVKSPRKEGESRKARIIFRREYSFYYLLTMLEGSARQIWGVFAMLAIVQTFHVDVRTVTVMLAINALVTVFMNPRIGVWIDQWGERKAMMVGYGGLIVVFLTFGLNMGGLLTNPLISTSMVAILIYFTYSTLFAFNALASPSYINKIVRPGELGPSLAMGITFEHLVGVSIPTLGGLIGVAYGYEYTFLIGTCIALICFAVVTKLPKGRLHSRAEGAVAVGH